MAAAAAGAISTILGHQHVPEGGGICPAALGGADPLRVAAVAIAVNEQDMVLLTKRPAAMRTFPSAWVLPGGALEEGDASIAECAARELYEETGLSASTSTASLVCLWESAFPTTPDAWRDAMARGTRRAHHVIVFVELRVQDAPLCLQEAECEEACWMPLADMTSILLSDGAVGNAVGSDGRPIPSHKLRGVYPNTSGEGIGRGHLFALSMLARKRTEARRRASPGRPQSRWLRVPPWLQQVGRPSWLGSPPSAGDG